MNNTDKIEVQTLGNEKFFELCKLAGLTKEQTMTCKSIVVSCESFGHVNVKVEYSAIGEIE